MKHSKHLNFFLIFLLLSSLFLWEYSNFKIKKLQITNIVSENKTDYSILLKPNSFFTEKELPSNNNYVSNAIDKININFNYQIKNQSLQNLKYYYEISTTLTGYTTEKAQEIWNKKTILEKNYQFSNKDFFLNQNISLDYQFYQKLKEDFENTYLIQLDTNLKVNLRIYTSEKEIDNNIELNIPINDTTTAITINENNKKQKTPIPKIYNIYQITSIISLLISLALIFLKFTQKFSKNEKWFLNKYHNLIIKVTKEPNIPFTNKIYISNAKDFGQIANNYNTFIILYKNTYYIFTTQYTYILDN